MSRSRRRALVHQRHRSPRSAAYRRGKHRNHPGVDIDDVGEEEPGAARDVTERRGGDARPGKPMPDFTVRFPGQHFLPRRRARRVDLDDNGAARCEEIADPPQGTTGVAADTDIAVGEQDLLPAALGRQRSEQVPLDRGTAPTARQLNRNSESSPPSAADPIGNSRTCPR
jgi:hypothetical protein